MDNITQQQVVCIRSLHPNAFRSGEWAKITRIELRRPIGSVFRNPCFVVKFEDGVIDLWAIGDAVAQYEFTYETVLKPETEKAEWLVWSHDHGAWWRPNRSGYTKDLWRAGRYTSSGALRCLGRDGWPNYGQEKKVPPEVAVLAPEAGMEKLTPEWLSDAVALMADRVVEAMKKRIAEEVS